MGSEGMCLSAVLLVFKAYGGDAETSPRTDSSDTTSI